MRFSGAILSNEGIVAEEGFAVSGPWSVDGRNPSDAAIPRTTDD